MGGLDPTFTSVMVIAMSVMSVVIVVINAGCIYIINWSSILRRKTASIFVYSILTLHLLQGCFVIPFYAAKKSPAEKSVTSRKFICDGFRLSYMVTFYGACVNVLLIGGDRLLAVLLLTSYKSIVTRQRAIIAVCSLWTYVFVLCMIPFAPEDGKFCRYNQQDEWTIFMLFFNTLVPYIFVTASYLYVTVKLDQMQKKTHVNEMKTNSTNNLGFNENNNENSHNNDNHNTNNDNNNNNHSSNGNYLGTSINNNNTSNLSIHGHNNRSERRKSSSAFSLFAFNNKKNKESEAEREKTKNIRKVTKVTFIIILAYGLTWAPSIIYYILLKVAPSIFTKEYNSSPAESYVTFFIKFITFFDAVFTPIIYCYFHTDFRREFDRFWQRFNKREDVIEIKDETTVSHRPRSCTSW